MAPERSKGGRETEPLLEGERGRKCGDAQFSFWMAFLMEFVFGEGCGVSSVSLVVGDVLSVAGLPADEIALYGTHSAKRAWLEIAAKAGLPKPVQSAVQASKRIATWRGKRSHLTQPCLQHSCLSAGRMLLEAGSPNRSSGWNSMPTTSPVAS